MAGDPEKKPEQSELIQQLAETFKAAQAKVEHLRDAIQRNTDLAQLQSTSAFLHRERDRALRDLGEVLWKASLKGEFTFPEFADKATDSLRHIEEKLDTHRSEIGAVLSEGAETADRLNAKNKKTHSSLASRSKKR